VRGRRTFSLRRWAALAALAAALVISFGAVLEAGALEPGDLVVADEFVGLIHVDAKTGQTTPIPTTGLALNWLAGVAIDRRGGVIVVSRNDLVRIDPDTGSSTELTSGGALDDFVGRVGIGPQGEILFTSTVNVGGGDLDGSITRVDPATGAQTPIVSGGLLGSVWDFGFASNGDVFVENSNTVVRIDGATSQQSFFLFTPDEDYGRLTVLPDDDLLVHGLANPGLQSTLLRVDAVTSGESRVPVPVGITGVESNEDGVIHYSWCFSGVPIFCETGEVLRITPSGTHEVVYSGISPLGFAIAPKSAATVPALPPWGPTLVALVVGAMGATALALRTPPRSA
jgi:hypothetical protein